MGNAEMSLWYEEVGKVSYPSLRTTLTTKTRLVDAVRRSKPAFHSPKCRPVLHLTHLIVFAQRANQPLWFD